MHYNFRTFVFRLGAEYSFLINLGKIFDIQYPISKVRKFQEGQSITSGLQKVTLPVYKLYHCKSNSGIPREAAAEAASAVGSEASGAE